MDRAVTDNRRMRNRIFLIGMLAGLLVACSPEADSDLVNYDSQTRISFSPKEVEFTAEGKTEDGNDTQKVIVTVNPRQRGNVAWTAKVDKETWCNVETTTIRTGSVEERGVVLSVNPNTEYRRKATLTVTTVDGVIGKYVISQLGLKADASVSVDTDNIEFQANDNLPAIFSFESNMGDVYDLTTEEGCTWLHVTDLGEGRGQITVDDYAGEESRMGKIYVHAGTAETSEATAEITVSQLPPDLYCYMFGDATPDYPTIASPLKMTKVEDGKYMANAWIRNGNLRIGNSLNANAYPQYYLGANGKLETIESDLVQNTPLPAIDIDGMRTLSLNLNTMTYTLTRISTLNCMPDEELSKYPTKAFVARDGSMKLWMTANVRWDGGEISPKLGSKMVSSATAATGGYASTADLPQSILDSKLNPTYEEAEIGGSLQGDDTHGRIYCFSEMLTGVPRAGIDGAINQTFPTGYQAGDEITDAVGKKIKLEYVVNPTDFSGDNKVDEEAHPMLTMQVQGICPYGWHIANAADYLDLAYAISKVSAGNTYQVLEENVTYKQFTTNSGIATGADSKRGIGNLACWLRNNAYWRGATYNYIADGADEFGFNLYPLGFRYLKQGYQMAGLRAQTWIPLYYNDKKAYRLNVVIRNHTSTYAEMSNVDNGNAILPFRCVKNYK